LLLAAKGKSPPAPLQRGSSQDPQAAESRRPGLPMKRRVTPWQFHEGSFCREGGRSGAGPLAARRRRGSIPPRCAPRAEELHHDLPVLRGRLRLVVHTKGGKVVNIEATPSTHQPGALCSKGARSSSGQQRAAPAEGHVPASGSDKFEEKSWDWRWSGSRRNEGNPRQELHAKEINKKDNKEYL